MRLSPWHMELAKRIAKGQPNRDIMKEIKVSGSRLSVLKANPVFAREVEKYRRKEDEKYNKALKVFSDKVEDVAKEVVGMATSALTPHKTRLDAALVVLEKVAQAEGQTHGSDQEVTFEQTLKITKKGMGVEEGVDESEADLEAAYTELKEDADGVFGMADLQSSGSLQ